MEKLKYIKTFEDFKYKDIQFFKLKPNDPDFKDLYDKYTLENSIVDIEDDDLSIDSLIRKLIVIDEGEHGVNIKIFNRIKTEIEKQLKRKISKKEIDKMSGDTIRILDENDNLIDE